MFNEVIEAMRVHADVGKSIAAWCFPLESPIYTPLLLLFLFPFYLSYLNTTDD